MYMTSLYFHEEGPFEKIQLAERAKNRLFTGEHWVRKEGESKWYPAWALGETREVLDEYFPPYQKGETGPAGGIIIFDQGEYKDGWRYTEAGPCCIAKVNYHEAVRLCAEYSHGGYRDWQLIDRESLVELLRLHKHGHCVDFNSPGWHWYARQSENPGAPQEPFKNYDDYAVVLSFWGPSGYFGSTAGHFEYYHVSCEMAVRPIRKF